MEKPLGHEAIASIVVLEAHRFVDWAADKAMATLAQVPSARPAGVAQPSPEPFPLGEGVWNGITAAVNERKRGTTLPYPPSEEGRLTEEELAALSALQLSVAARAGLRKIVRDAASAPLFRMFCLLDAVGDPELTQVANWLPINLERPHDGADRSMVHDDFYDSYLQYAECRARGTT